MNESMDGRAAGPVMTKQQIEQANAMLQQLEQPVKIVIWNALSGLLASFPGFPLHAVLGMAAMQAGLFVGSAIQGELSSVLQIRKGFEEAFREGVRKTPPNIKAMTPPPPGLRG